MSFLSFIILISIHPALQPLQQVVEKSYELSIEDGAMSIIEKLDQEVRRKHISACAAFSFLFRYLYERNQLNILRTLPYSMTLLGDLRELGIEFNKGYSKIPELFWAQKREMEIIFRRIFKIHNRDFSTERLKMLFSPLGLMDQSIIKFRNRAFYGKWKWQKYPWLTMHKGSFGASQGLQSGYFQEFGDDDESGRHDHIMMNIFVGYTLEKQRLFLKRDSLLKSAQGLVIWGELGLPGGSKTDAMFNAMGMDIGFRIADEKWSGDFFENEIFYTLCDESVLLPRFPGPLSELLK